MAESSDNPIITRLQQFMAFKGMSNSQFADTTGIPRPTISQLLHGRNKSINDQFIRKLHDTFPDLNVVWLLFGKGEMQMDGNIESSAAQSEDISPDNALQQSDFQTRVGHRQTQNDVVQSDANENYQAANVRKSLFDMDDDDIPSSEGPFRSNPADSRSPDSQVNSIIESSTANTNPAKKITSIIVFYSDNSFETFLPDR